MVLFKNPEQSHDHSLKTLDLIYKYDDYLDSLTVIADMGCGAGHDVRWWATLETRDDPPEPHNYLVYAVDKRIDLLEPDVAKLSNVIPVEGDFAEPLIPRKIDLLWAHDSFQYARDPLRCLAAWKQSMALNGMLVITLPQMTYWDHTYNKLMINQYNYQFHNYNLVNLIYMLAINGFDCRDAYFYRETNTPWLSAAVYATEHEPMPASTGWHELAEKRLINDSFISSINKYGYVRLEDVVVCWLDKAFYKITD